MMLGKLVLHYKLKNDAQPRSVSRLSQEYRLLCVPFGFLLFSLFCLKPLSFSERENGEQPTKQPRYKGKKVGIGGWAVSTSAKIPSRSDKAERKNR
jgi:hypothetical protein